MARTAPHPACRVPHHLFSWTLNQFRGLTHLSAIATVPRIALVPHHEVFMRSNARRRRFPDFTTSFLCTLALLSLFTSRIAAAPPERYRDFKVYTTSAPDPNDPARIVATMKLMNGSKTPLNVHVSLDAAQAAGFAGGKHAAAVEPGA